MRWIVLLVVLASTVAAADPAKLPELPVGGKPSTKPVRVFANGAPVDWVLRLLVTESYLKVASDRTITGRIGAPGPEPTKGTSTADAFAALLGSDKVVKVKRGSGTGTVTLDFGSFEAVDLLKLCADVKEVDVVIASSRKHPKLSAVVKAGDALVLAKAAAKLVGLELVMQPGTWIFVDPGVELDRKLLGKVRKGVELFASRANADEIRMHLDPSAPPRACGGVEIHARVRKGRTGPLEAVLAAYAGAGCKVATTPYDAGKDRIVVRSREPTLRAITRRADGSVSVETPAQGTDAAEALYLAPIGDPLDLSPAPAPPCSDKPDPRWKLHAVVMRGVRAWALMMIGNERFVAVERGDDPLTGAVEAVEAGAVRCANQRVYKL